MTSNKRDWDWSEFTHGVVLGYIWLGFILALIDRTHFSREGYAGLALAFFCWVFIIYFFQVVW